MPIEPSAAAELPLVTVVTPSYNQGRFIAATIESVLGQDYPNLEYIIVDGASTDETAEVVARYGNRLRFISEPDRGQSDAINKGFRLARGEIVAWLNSDDVFLPGAVQTAVAALRSRPDVGAVYGEGFQIDEQGQTISRFASTQRFDLWRLLHLSDYILQQTVFFRRSVFDQVGWIDEDLHYGMDWEILIRIALQWPLLYIPFDMGAIREYPTAKSFAGGAKRAHELTRMLQRHTGRRFPPGMFVYGLPTYAQLVNERIDRALRSRAPWLVPRLQRRVTSLAHRIVGHVVQNSQGIFTDDWITTRAHFAFSPSRGRSLEIDVELPGWTPLKRQELTFVIDGRVVARERIGPGDHTLRIATPQETWDRPIAVTVRASQAFRPSDIAAGNPDRRRLCALVHRFEFETPRGAG